jgi:hypothetical protein
MIAFGVNLLNGFFINLPSLAIESPDDVICLPSETRFVQSRDSRVASKVSIRAYSMR